MEHTNESLRAVIDIAKALKTKAIESIDTELDSTKRRLHALESERAKLLSLSPFEVLENDTQKQTEILYWSGLEKENTRIEKEKRADELHRERRFAAGRVFKLVLAGTLPLALATGAAAAYSVSPTSMALACAFYYCMLCFVGTVQP